MRRQFSLCSIFVIVAASAVLNAQNFSNPVRIPTSSEPISVFAVDLNGDGLLDLVYETAGVNSTPGTIQTLLGQPSGGYMPALVTTLPLVVGDCHPVDVNRDGKLDLVCTNYIDECDYQIATLLSNGDGSFQSPIYSGLMHSTCIYAPFYAWLYTPADVNSDSFPDLIVGDGYNFEFFVLLGDGKGHFNVSFTADAATVQDGYGGEMFVADLNGDGKADLFANWGAAVWLGKGDGTFTYKGTYGGNCTLFDIEADGHPDAVCGPSLSILHGNPDGSFNKTPVATTVLKDGAAGLDYPTTILDVNGDGILDIVGESTDGLSVLFGQGNLKFGPPAHYAVGDLSFGGAGSITSQTVDLNGDGVKDIIATGPSGLYISYGNKNGTFGAPPAYQVANLLGQVSVADFNGDGIPDIAATGDTGIEISLGNGDGTFKPFVAQPNGTTTFSQSDGHYMQIAHGDFRGKGKQDLLAVGGSYPSGFNPYIQFGNGDGTFSSPQVVNGLLGTGWGAYPGSINDFDNDGRDDIFSFGQNAVNDMNFYVALSNGDGTFNSVTTTLPVATGTMTSASFPAFADFNRDGKLDAVLAEGASAYVFLGNGDGSFNTSATVLSIPTYQGSTPSPLSVTKGDFDGDGNPDFAVLAQVGGFLVPPAPVAQAETAVYVFYGNGNGTFSGTVIAGGFDHIYDTVYSADLAMNGRSDLILLGSGDASILPGTEIAVVPSIPGRLFGPRTPFMSGSTAGGAFVADINKDGYPDILVSNTGYGQTKYTYNFNNSVTELLNLGPQTTSNLLTTNTALATTNSSFVAGTTVTLTATVNGISLSNGSPTGSVRFADQTGVESTVPLVSTSSGLATAKFTTNMIGIGSDTVVATYSGDTTFAPSSATIPLTATGLPDNVSVTAAPTTLTLGKVVQITAAVNNPAGSAAAAPTGYIEIRDGSSTILGLNRLSGGSIRFNTELSRPGAHLLSARYSGDLLHVSNSGTVTVQVVANPGFSFTPSQPTVSATQAASINVTITSVSGLPTPTGSVVLSGGGFTSQTVTLSNGTAAVSVPAGTFAVGGYWLSATYSPDTASSNYYAATTAQSAVYLTVTSSPPPGFTISGTSVTVVPGATTGNTSTITLTPSNGFTGAINLTCTITPTAASDPATCSISSSVAISGSIAQTTALTVNTTAAFSAFNGVGRFLQPLVGGTALACILLLGIPARRRRWWSALRMLILFFGIIEAGCGGGGNTGGGGVRNPGTTPGTYTITVTGTSGTITQSGTATLTVQ